MNIQKLIDHCHEYAPQLETAQADILAAQEELDALEMELARLRRIESAARDVVRILPRILPNSYLQINLVALLNGKE